MAKIDIARRMPVEMQFRSRLIKDILLTTSEINEVKLSGLLQHFLYMKLSAKDLVMMQMLADRAIADEKFKAKLIEIVYLSYIQAFSNADTNFITALNHA